MRRLCMVVCLAVCLILTGLFSSAVAMGQYEEQAVQLQSLGLLKGSSTGFDLLRAPKRVESAVMLVRLLGKEAEVLAGSYSHPFADVPTWAHQYIGYMYENQLTNGKTATTFGSNDLTDAKSYMTFALRALGYSDSQGDFNWAGALQFAAEKGVITAADATTLGTKTFLRDDMVLLSANALKATLKNSPDQLIDKLVQSGAVSQAKVDQSPLFVEPIILRIQTAMMNGVLTTTYDTSTLPKAIRERITGVENSWATNRTNLYTKEELYLLCDRLTSVAIFKALPKLEHTWKPYPTQVLSIYVDGNLYGMSQIVSPAEGSKDLIIIPWLQEEYNQFVGTKLTLVTDMVKEAQVIAPGDIGWSITEGGFLLYDLKDVFRELDACYVSITTSNHPWDEAYIISSLMSTYGRDGELVNDRFEISQPELGIAMSASEPDSLPYEQGAVMLIFNKDKELVAYSILNEAMPQQD